MNERAELVTIFGGAGYIGSILTRLLLAEGYNVRVFDNFSFGKAGLANIKAPGLEVIEADIVDTRAVSAAIEGAETVVLLSSLVGHRIRELEHVDTRTVNLLASSVVLDASLEHGVSKFIFASTNSVYGVQGGVLYETTIPQPISLYSRLKLRMEERVMNARKRSFHPVSLRIATCHGYSPRMRFDLVANSMMRDAVVRQRIDLESGEQWRSLIHVEDAARGFLACINAHVNLISGEIFNLGNKGQNIQLNHLANVVKTLAPEVEIHITEGQPDLINYHLSSSRIEKILDFNCRWSLEDSLSEVRDRLKEGEFGDPYSLRYQNT